MSPELIINQGIEDLFVIYTSGNHTSTPALTSIEYAVISVVSVWAQADLSAQIQRVKDTLVTTRLVKKLEYLERMIRKIKNQAVFQA